MFSIITKKEDPVIRLNSNKPKLLWTGNWSGGSITVPNTDEYDVFAVTVFSSGNRILATKNSTKNRVTGILGAALSSNNNQYIDIITASISGNTWTLTNKHEVAHVSNGNHSPTAIAFSEIYGVVKSF